MSWWEWIVGVMFFGLLASFIGLWVIGAHVDKANHIEEARSFSHEFKTTQK